MINCTKLENEIRDQLIDKNDYIIFNNILLQIAEENNITLKDIKSILYQNKSKFYETSGYINGKRISLQNLIITFKKLIKRIFQEVENSIDYELTYEEKIKILKYIEYNMRMKSIII